MISLTLHQKHVTVIFHFLQTLLSLVTDLEILCMYLFSGLDLKYIVSAIFIMQDICWRLGVVIIVILVLF